MFTIKGKKLTYLESAKHVKDHYLKLQELFTETNVLDWDEKCYELVDDPIECRKFHYEVKIKILNSVKTRIEQMSELLDTNASDKEIKDCFDPHIQEILMFMLYDVDSRGFSYC